MAFQQLVEAVPFYAGLTLDAIGGQRRALARARAGDERSPTSSARRAPPAARASGPRPPRNGHLRLGTFRSIWASPEVETSPALKFLAARQRAELSPEDAERLGMRNGERVAGRRERHPRHATVALRHDVPPGTVFLEENVAEDGANLLSGEQLVEVRRS